MFQTIVTTYTPKQLKNCVATLTDSLYRARKHNWCYWMQEVWQKNLETAQAEIEKRTALKTV